MVSLSFILLLFELEELFRLEDDLLELLSPLEQDLSWERIRLMKKDSCLIVELSLYCFLYNDSSV